MTRRQSRTRVLAALFIGVTLGAVMSAGTALLLYTGQGFLRAAGLLISSTIMALAAGLWAGAPDREQVLPTRGRWLACALALIAGGAFVTVWNARATLRDVAAGGALAVLLTIALPAYIAGALLAALHSREARGSGGVAAAAAAGAAFGILLATSILIQELEPYGIYYGGAAIVALASLLDRAPARRMRTGVPDMTDQILLVTGAGERGQLGYLLARRALDAGARVVISARTEAVQQIAEELSAHGDVAALAADLTRDDDVTRLVSYVRERHARLDALINVAGGLSVTGRIDAVDPGEWLREYERNTITALRLCRAALPLLRESHGAVVNFASPAGQRAVPGLGAYSAAKAGVIALTRALAIEEKSSGVRVNAIAPGMMDTQQNREEMGDDVKWVAREDVADVALFLAGPGARGVTGETIHVLGGTIR